MSESKCDQCGMTGQCKMDCTEEPLKPCDECGEYLCGPDCVKTKVVDLFEALRIAVKGDKR